MWTAWSYRLILSAIEGCHNRVNREIFVSECNNKSHHTLCLSFTWVLLPEVHGHHTKLYARHVAPTNLNASQTLLSECAQITHSTPSIFTLLVKKAFLFGGGGFTEDSDCLPSAFKILSERLNVKGKFRAKPQHTHQSLSKQREGLLPSCG